MEKNKVFFAFGKAVETKEAAPIKRYIGIAPVQIVAVNPSKEELEKIYNRQLDKAPEYLGVQEINGKNVPYARLDFIVKTNPEKSNGIDMISKISLYVRDAKMTNKDNTKCNVVDKYGRTAWVTVEEFKDKLIPQYSNGPARIDKNYKALYNGEAQVLSFIKTFLGINDVDEYVDGVWRMRSNPEDYEAGFNNIDKWFKGDFSEITEAVKLMPNNYIKVLFGVKSVDGKEYQDVFTRAFAKGNSSSTKGFEKALKEAKDSGAYANTEFEICDLKEYSPVPTTFEPTPSFEESDDLPFNF